MDGMGYARRNTMEFLEVVLQEWLDTLLSGKGAELSGKAQTIQEAAEAVLGKLDEQGASCTIYSACFSEQVCVVGKFEDSPKTATSLRTIPLTTDMEKIIERQKQQWHEEKILQLDAYIFHLEDGTPISRERLQGEINRILRHAADDGYTIDRFTPHCLRHTFATRAIEAGMEPQVLKAILGHSTLSMTMDLYAHVMSDKKAEEMEKIAGSF